MQRSFRNPSGRLARLLREPTVHFFVVAVVILVVQRVVVRDPRVIVITPALRADLVRRFQDQLSRPPTSAEIESYMRAWKRDEALYREALREGIDRDDLSVRTVLIGQMRERAVLATRAAEPTDSDLQQYLEEHRDLFEAPFLYEHEYVTFAKNEPGAEQRRAKYKRELQAGATTAALGLRSVAANVNRERIDQEFGSETAELVRRLPIGKWEALETDDRFLLVRMIHVEGGLPDAEVLHERLVGAWKASMAQKAIERASQAIADRYRFVESSQ